MSTQKFSGYLLLIVQKCQDSTTSHTIAGAIGLDRNPSFTPDASRLLEEHGPDLFKTIFGSHFIWRIIVGAEAGFCFSMGSDKHTERESISVVVDINLLFWSISIEGELTSKLESHLDESFNFTYFDTLTNTYVNENGTEFDLSNLYDRAKTIRDNVGKIEQRLASRLQVPTRLADAVLTSENLSSCVVGMLVAPWSILDEWHAGVKKWRLSNHS